MEKDKYNSVKFIYSEEVTKALWYYKSKKEHKRNQICIYKLEDMYDSLEIFPSQLRILNSLTGRFTPNYRKSAERLKSSKTGLGKTTPQLKLPAIVAPPRSTRKNSDAEKLSRKSPFLPSIHERRIGSNSSITSSNTSKHMDFKSAESQSRRSVLPVNRN